RESRVRVRGESPEHLRHSDRLLVVAVPDSNHRERVPGPLSVSRLASAAYGTHAGGSATTRSGGSVWASVDVDEAGPLAHCVSRRDAQPGWSCGAVQRRQLLSGARSGAAGCPDLDRWQSSRHAEGSTRDISRTGKTH